MSFFIRFIAIFFVAFGVIAQQAKIREVDTFSLLRNHVQDLDRTRFVKGYHQIGDGGHGFFVFTNTAIATNLGTRIEVTGRGYSWERQHDGNVDIRWFGAVDGALDSTAAIQAAIDYCSAHNFTTVIPSGEYGVVSTLLLRDNTKLVGTSTKSVLFAQATTITLSGAFKTNILLRDFTLAGTASVQLRLSSCQDVVVEGVTQSGAILDLAGYRAGIEVNAGDGIRFSGVTQFGNGINTLTNNLDYNFVSGLFNEITTNLTIVNHTIDNLYSKFGIALFNPVNAKVRDGFINMNLKGTTNNADGYAIIVYGKDGIATAIRPSIIGTTITNTYGTGILFRNVVEGEIIGVQMAKVSQTSSDFAIGHGGISVTRSQNVRIENVGIFDSGINSGIEMDSTTNITVVGGSIYLPGTNRYGIEIRGYNFGTSIKGVTITDSHRAIGTTIGNGVAEAADIEGNVLRNMVDGVILLTPSSNNIVRGNRIYNNAGTGITDQGSYTTIANNIISGGQIGIYAIGSNGIIPPNEIQGQVTGVSIVGSGYRMDLMGRYHDNAIPINDAGGAIIKPVTTGTTPSVKDSPGYMLTYAAPVTITDFTDGLLGMRRTFFTANTNATIQHGATIVLDGAGNFNMKPGDSLTLERDNTGSWKQVGKSIDSNWMWFDRAADQLYINAPVYHFNNWLQYATPSTTVYADDHWISTNNVASALIARWFANGNVNGLTIGLTPDKTNYLFGFSGIQYKFPLTNLLSGQVLTSDGLTPSQLYGTNIGGGSTYNFDPTQFSSAGGSVAITNGALTTNMVLKGAVSSPVLNVSGVNIDAATGTEFSKQLASNTSLGIINMIDGQAVSVTITNTTFTLSWTNVITWLSGVTPVIDTNAVNVFHFFRTGGRVFGSDPEQLANANIVGLATIAGTGVVVKTNSTSFTTYNPLPIAYGGTGTNFFSSTADGAVIFYSKSQDQMMGEPSQFTYQGQTLYLGRTVPTGIFQLFIAEGLGGGTDPAMLFYANKIEQANDDFTLNTIAGSNVVVQIGSAAAFKISKDHSTVIGNRSTGVTRNTNFVYIPITDGPPTGTPVTETGTDAMVYDASNKRLYVYQGGWNWIGGSGTLSFTGAVNGVVYSPDGSNLTNGTGIYISGTGATQQLNALGVDPFRIQNAASDTIVFGATNINFDPFVSSSSSISMRNTGVYDLLFRFTGEDPMITMAHERSLVLGMTTSTNVARTTNFVYLQTTRGAPTGVPVALGGVALTYDTVNNRLMAYNAGWQNVGSGGASDNWVALGTTNSQLHGQAYANTMNSTNGYIIPGGASYVANVLTLINSGGPATVQNTSATRLSSLLLKGGAGAESSITFNTAATNRASFDSNGVFHAWYGTRSDNARITNGVTIYDVQATNIVGTDANQKLAKVNVGAGLTWTPGTMTLSVAGGGSLAGSGTPTYYSQWTGAASLGDGGLYHIDSTALGLGSTNFFLHTHGSINNLGLGEAALAQVVAGAGNTVIGRNAGAGITSGTDNVVVGQTALTVAQSSSQNIAIGAHSMAQSNNSSSNTFVGHYSGVGNSTGNENSGVGAFALRNTTTPFYNSALGSLAGSDNLTGAYNTYIGAYAGYFDGNGTLTYTNTSALGYGSLATNNNAVVLGNQNVTRWQMGSSGPAIIKGAGTPEAAVQGNVGDLFIRTDGGVNTTMYWKESGSGNTGWVIKPGPASVIARLNVESGKLPSANPARINNVSDYLWELLFDASTSQSSGFSFVMPQEYGSALKVRFKTSCKSGQTGVKSAIYRFYIAALKATEDPTNPTFSSANSVTVTMANNQTANQVVESTVTLTNADSVAAGDLVILKVDRDAANGSDDVVGDATLVGSMAVEWVRQ